MGDAFQARATAVEPVPVSPLRDGIPIADADRALFRELERFVFQSYSGVGLDGEAIEVIARHRLALIRRDAPQVSPPNDDALFEALERDLKAAAAKLSAENKAAMSRCSHPDDRAELRAENVGHSVMLHEALALVRALHKGTCP